MQPNNTVNNTSSAPAPMTTPMNPGGDIVFKDKPKKKTGLIIGILFLVLLAAGGIGFGIWAYLDGNQKASDLNSQIFDLQNQIANQPEIDETVIDVENNNNPIIKSKDNEEAYHINFISSPVWENDGTAKVIEIGVINGDIEHCNVNTKQWDGNGGNTMTKIGDCSIDGLSDSVYKMVEFGAGQDNSNSSIGFIMTDGTVKYLPLYDSINNNNFAIRGSLKVDDYVTDIFDVVISPTNSPVGGYVSSIIVFNDGSFVKYDESML